MPGGIGLSPIPANGLSHQMVHSQGFKNMSWSGAGLPVAGLSSRQFPPSHPSASSFTAQSSDSASSYTTLSSGNTSPTLAFSPSLPQTVSDSYSSTEYDSSGDAIGDRSTTNVYIKGLPAFTSEAMLIDWARQIGCEPISVKVVREHPPIPSARSRYVHHTSKYDTELASQNSLCTGIGFVKFQHPFSAAAFLALVNNSDSGCHACFAKETYAGKIERAADTTSANLYLAHIPLDYTEPDILALFPSDRYVVKSLRFLREGDRPGRRGAHSTKFKGAAFCRLATREMAVQALAELDGIRLSTLHPDSSGYGGQSVTETLQVRFADSERQKMVKAYDKAVATDQSWGKPQKTYRSPFAVNTVSEPSHLTSASRMVQSAGVAVTAAAVSADQLQTGGIPPMRNTLFALRNVHQKSASAVPLPRPTSLALPSLKYAANAVTDGCPRTATDYPHTDTRAVRQDSHVLSVEPPTAEEAARAAAVLQRYLSTHGSTITSLTAIHNHLLPAAASNAVVLTQNILPLTPVSPNFSEGVRSASPESRVAPNEQSTATSASPDKTASGSQISILNQLSTSPVKKAAPYPARKDIDLPVPQSALARRSSAVEEALREKNREQRDLPDSIGKLSLDNRDQQQSSDSAKEKLVLPYDRSLRSFSLVETAFQGRSLDMLDEELANEKADIQNREFNFNPLHHLLSSRLPARRGTHLGLLPKRALHDHNSLRSHPFNNSINNTPTQMAPGELSNVRRPSLIFDEVSPCLSDSGFQINADVEPGFTFGKTFSGSTSASVSSQPSIWSD